MRPADLGFRIAADGVAHARCWMAWPVRVESWGERLGDARDEFMEIASAIARFEPVTVVVKPTKVAEVSLRTASGIASFALPHDDSWLHDNGPTFLIGGDGSVAGVQWKWNGWAGRVPDCERDAEAATKLLEQMKMRRFEAPILLEGGAIVTDGDGTLFASEPILLDPKRNPGLDKAAAEEILRAYLGVEAVIWLGAGLDGDPAGGRLDNLICMLQPGQVAALTTADSADSNFAALSDLQTRLKAAADAKGRALEILPIEQPRIAVADNGRRLPLSYVSLYQANGGVVMPAFEGPQDKRAFEALSRAFAGRKVVQVPSNDIAQGGGGIRTLCLGQPAGAAAAAL